MANTAVKMSLAACHDSSRPATFARILFESIASTDFDDRKFSKRRWWRTSFTLRVSLKAQRVEGKREQRREKASRR